MSAPTAYSPAPPAWRRKHRNRRRRDAPAGPRTETAAARSQSKAIEAQIAALQAEAESEAAEVKLRDRAGDLQERLKRQNTDAMAQLRDGATAGNGKTKEPDERQTITNGLPEPHTSNAALRAGQTPKSLAAFANLKRICETHLAGQYRIEVIDLMKTPQLAAGDQIFAVPTLVRRLPEPIKKIIGDLSNEERVLVGLDIQPVEA